MIVVYAYLAISCIIAAVFSLLLTMSFTSCLERNWCSPCPPLFMADKETMRKYRLVFVLFSLPLLNIPLFVYLSIRLYLKRAEYEKEVEVDI